MLRVRIEVEPHGDKTRAREIAEITIANITRALGRVSSDYAWRIRHTAREGAETTRYGTLVDSYNSSAVYLLFEVLAEAHSGRELPLDNHGHKVALIADHAAFWSKADPPESPR